MRIPFIFYHPTIKKRHVEAMCLNIDLAPTLLEIAGLKVPRHIQGKSMQNLLKDDKNLNWRRSFLFEYFKDNQWPYAGPTLTAIRTENFKLVDTQLKNDIDELYNLKNDPGEMENLINNKDFDSIQTFLRTELNRLKMKYGYTDKNWLLKQLKKQP